MDFPLPSQLAYCARREKYYRMVHGLNFIARLAAPASFEACAYREYPHDCRVSRFADDGIVNDRVARKLHLNAFAGLRKADNLFDCERNPVQAASANMTRAVDSMEFET